METITQKYNKYIKDLFPKKPEDINPLSLSSVTFTPPPSNILQYFNSIKSSDKKGSNYQSLNSSLSFEELPDELKYTIEEEYHNELLSFDTTLKRIGPYLVKPYYKKHSTAEELFISVEIGKEEIRNEDVVKARIKAEMTWESLSSDMKRNWEKLPMICEKFWASTFQFIFFDNFITYYKNRTNNSSLNLDSLQSCKELQESYYKSKIKQLKTLGAWLIANHIYFPKRQDIFFYRIWKCDYLIKQIQNNEPLSHSRFKQIHLKDKDAFEKFLAPIRLTEQFVNYMVKNEVSYEMRQKYTPLYMFYLEKKDILSSLDKSVEEKMEFIETEWSKLKEEEKRKYTLQVYDKLYNSTIALYDEEIGESNMATAKKRMTISRRKSKLEDSEEDEDEFTESEDKAIDSSSESLSESETEEEVSTIKKRKVNKEQMIQYIKENYKSAKKENSNLSKNELITLLIYRYKNSSLSQSTKATKKINKDNESTNKKKRSICL